MTASVIDERATQSDIILLLFMYVCHWRSKDQKPSTVTQNRSTERFLQYSFSHQFLGVS